MSDSNKRNKPYVVCAAMLMDDGHIVTGVRHFSPDMRATLRRLYPRNWFMRLFGARPLGHLRVKEQGFVDQYGTFLSREIAYSIAKANKQFRRNSGSTMEELYSEDIY
jgi:hypothetical protein